MTLVIPILRFNQIGLNSYRSLKNTLVFMDNNLRGSILIIEDEEIIRESYKALLEIEGYTVHTASQGAEGLQVLKSIPTPSLILLDLCMPTMNGIEFLEIKSRDLSISSIPVCVISGIAKRPDLSKSTLFLSKPIDFDVLVKIVAQHCGVPVVYQ